MNRLTHLFLVLFLLCLPTSIMAQKDDDDDDDDSRYLIGAVPEVNGKVVFSKEFSIPGMSEEQIFERMMKWMDERLKENKNQNSRVVYSDKTKGLIAGVGEEWIVFKSSALSLDRTLVNYQITVTYKSGQCLMEIEKMRFAYRENEKYPAEGWITDEFALNKTKTKLVRGLAKWRRKSVDLADNLFANAAQALGAAEKVEPENKPSARKAITAPGPVVITSAAAPGNISGYTQVAPEKVPASAIQMGAGKLVIAIGNDAFNMTMMTANAGGSLGEVSGNPVVSCVLSPDQPYEQMEKVESYSVRFYPTGQTEPSVILECKKLPSQAPLEGQPRTYVGEIIKAWIK